MSADNSNPNSRVPGRPFAKGKSGNPGGRPKGYGKFRKEARRVVDEKVIAAWENEVASLGDDWVKCSELLAAYGYGKAPSAPDDNKALASSGSGLPAGTTIDDLRALAKGEK
jgi:hypothetical protein